MNENFYKLICHKFEETFFLALSGRRCVLRRGSGIRVHFFSVLLFVPDESGLSLAC